MTAKLNHTIVSARDKETSALFMSEILGLPPPVAFGHFVLVTVGDELTLDFRDKAGEIAPQHYAFLVSETEFDEIFARILARGIDHWADPARRRAGQINRWEDGRGVYFPDPDNHLLEILTRPYGSQGMSAEHPHPLVARALQPEDGDRTG